MTTGNRTASSKIKPFEFQNWTVYEKALAFGKEANVICAQLPKDGNRSIVDQLRRASQSIALNIAEGCSRYGRKDKVNFWRIAKGSVFECVAILDLLQSFGFLDPKKAVSLKDDLAHVGRMLSGLIRWVENNSAKSKTTDLIIG